MKAASLTINVKGEDEDWVPLMKTEAAFGVKD